MPISLIWCCLMPWCATPEADSLVNFPQHWQGYWSGDLLIYPPGKAEQMVPMALDIQPLEDGRWSWTLIYMPGDDEDRRAYTLQPVDPALGRWEVDEHNGIVLESRYLGGCLLSRFAVMDQLLLARYCLRADVLEFEIIAGAFDQTPANTPEGDMPAVFNLPVGVYQRADLIRR